MWRPPSPLFQRSSTGRGGALANGARTFPTASPRQQLAKCSPVGYLKKMSTLPTFYTADAKDPTSLVWPPTLPIELALKTASPEELRHEYGYSIEEWEALPKNAVFMKELAGACELVRQEGMSFKLKAKLIAEENLKQVWKMVHDSNNLTPPVVRAKLIELTARWAGFDPKSNGDSGPGGVNVAAGLQININLGEGY